MARLGGDEFGLLLPGVRDAASAYELAAKAQAALAEELVLDGVSLVIEASFGIALYPQDALADEDLMRYADAAMYQAKRGTHGIIHYDAAHAGAHQTVSACRPRCDGPSKPTSCVLHYQPKIDLCTGVVTASKHLSAGSIRNEGCFLRPSSCRRSSRPVLSTRSPRGCLITRWPTARDGSRRGGLECRCQRVGPQPGLRHLPERRDRGPGQSGTSPARLQIEVTETALSINQDTAAANLRALAAHGRRRRA